jgi:CheY-like chemotaxis protein
MKYGILLDKDAFFIFNEKYSNKIHPPYDPLNFQSYNIKRIQQCGSKYVIDCVPQRNNPDIPSSTTISLSMITPEKLQVVESGAMNGNYQLLFDLTNYTSYKTSDPRDIGVWNPSRQFESEELTIETRLITTNIKKNHSGSASDSFDIKSIYKDKNNNRIYVISEVGSKSNESMIAVIIIDRNKGRYFNSWDVSGNKTFDFRKFKMNDIAFDYGNFQKLSRRADTVSTTNVVKTPVRPVYSILWVDDHPENNKAIITDLENEGIKTAIALSNQEARNLINDRSSSYDLIITDIDRDQKENNVKQQNVNYNDNGISFIRSLTPAQIRNVIVYTLDSNISIYKSELMKMGIIDILANPDELKQIIFQKFKISKAKY